jgi:hypothetical protein
MVELVKAQRAYRERAIGQSGKEYAENSLTLADLKRSLSSKSPVGVENLYKASFKVTD